MTKYDEISSTEKLLDLIRGKSVKGSGLPVLSPSPYYAEGIKASLLKLFTLKKKIVVGVDISSKDLRLVKISRLGEQKGELLDYSHTSFDPSINKSSPRFLPLLKSALTTICDTSKQYEIWSTISSANVETRYLRIPKVSKKQIANAVYWTYKKDISFNEQNEVFDYDVLGDIIEDGIAKIEVMAYSVPKQEIDELSNIFSKSGYPLTGISMVPFALQNLFRTRWIENGNNVCSLFVGRDWSRIAIFSKGNLILSRDIKAGIKSMLEAIREEIGQTQPERSEQSLTLDSSDETALLESFDENYNGDMDKAHELLFGLIDNTLPLSEKQKVLNSNSEKVFRMILPALDRVTRQIERTIRHYYLNFGDEHVRKIFVSGQISSNRSIVGYISDQLNLPAENIDPFVPESYSSVDFLAPESESERGSFVPAVGLALSNNTHTPNFIFTYKDKEKFALKMLVRRLVFGAALLLITITVGFSLWQSIILDRKKTGIAQLQRQMEQYNPVVDQNLIISMVAKTKRNIDTAEAFVAKYLVMAVISEITQITPSEIRLSSITADLSRPKGSSSLKESQGQKKLLKIEGVILGDRLNFEASLAGYLVRLKSSPMFSRATIKETDYVLFEGQEVLRFTAQLELIRN